MEIDFNSTLALFYGFLVITVAFGYVLAFQPITEVTPGFVRHRLQGYYSRLIMLSAHLLFDRAFKIEQTGTRIDPKESAIILCNHQSVLDYILMVTEAKDQGLESNCFFFIDKAVVRFPTLHTLTRRWRGHNNWTIPPNHLDRVFDIVHSASKKHARWIVIFPEVNPINPQLSHAQQLTMKYAGMKTPYKHLLYPRLASTMQAIEYLRSSTITAVYDLTVIYSHNTEPQRSLVPSLLSVIISNQEWQVRVLVKRFGVSSLPRSRKKLEKWVEDLWTSKEKYLEKQARRAKV